MMVHRKLAGWRERRHGPHYQGRSVGLVPTMGALHAGHRALLERARAENERVVLTIFVNPTQFNDVSDLGNYPRTLEADFAMARELADDVIVPEPDEIYPDGYRFRVSENEWSRLLEGAHRPGHFEGVLTVVLKLLHLVRPQRAYFGEKDWQQLRLVREMVRALLLDCEIVSCATVRDHDGLALSSRNRRLSPEGRARAAGFPGILRSAADPATAWSALAAAGFGVDYVEEHDGVRLGAVRIEGIRLIDNVRV